MVRTALVCWSLLSALLADKIPPAAALTGHKGRVIAVVFAPDGKRLASVSDDRCLKIWDIKANKQLASLDDTASNQNALRFSPDGKTIYALGVGARLLVVDAETGKAKPPIEIANLPGGPMAFDLSRDGTTIAVVGRSTLRFYETAAGKLTHAYEVHAKYAVPGVCFASDGKSVATIGTDRKALIVEVASGKTLRFLDLPAKGVTAAFAPDGKRLFIYTDDRVVLGLNLASGETSKLFSGGVEVFTMSVTPDGKRIVAAGASRDGPGLISTADAKLEPIAFECEDRVTSAAVSPDGHWIAAGGNEGSIRIWKLPE